MIAKKQISKTACNGCCSGGNSDLLFSVSISSSKTNLGVNNGKEFRLHKISSVRAEEY